MQFLFPLIIIITTYTCILSKVFNRKLNKDESDLEAHNTISLKSLDDISIKKISKIRKQATISEASTQRGKKLEVRQHGGNQSTKSKIKTIQLTATVIILYIICSTPFFIGMILQEMRLYDTNRVFSNMLFFTFILFKIFINFIYRIY
jgi:hypothetical protein